MSDDGESGIHCRLDLLFDPNRLVALEDGEGFAVGLGIALASSGRGSSLEILTPDQSLETVTALNLGDLRVDPGTFFDAQAPLR
jgi:polynucleotide 5'-kinase involved in rRNA processing